MGVFTYVGNVITGRLAHWNDANNRSIADLWERCAEFPDGLRIPFQNFVVSSASLMDALLGPHEGRDRLIKKDPLRITRRQFTQMHELILESFAGVFVQINPSLSESFKRAIAVLTGRSPNDLRIFQHIQGMEQLNLYAVGSAVWKEIVSIAESPQGTTISDKYRFTMLLGALGIESFKEINTELFVGSSSPSLDVG